jgi:hypothetical protein
MRYTILLLSTCFCFTACDKESNSDNTGKSELLTSAEWKYDNGGIGNSNGNIIVDFSSTSIVPSCMFDNSLRFTSNGTGTVAENTNVCTGAPATSSFSWNLSSDETMLNLSSGVVAGIGGSFKIKELTSTKLTLMKDTTITGFGAATAIVNFKH